MDNKNQTKPREVQTIVWILKVIGGLTVRFSDSPKAEQIKPLVGCWIRELGDTGDWADHDGVIRASVLPVRVMNGTIVPCFFNQDPRSKS